MVCGALLVAFFWWATLSVAEVHIAIVVIVGITLGGAVGTASWAAVLPFISTHYPEHLISAFYPEEQLVVPPTNVDGPVGESFNTL